MEGLCRIAALEQTDIVLNSVVGMVGLLPTLTAIDAGKDIALANKETLVAGGELVMSRAREKGVKIYPVDSEHSAIFQCLQGNKRSQLRKIILTASGGPFYGKSYDELRCVTKADALKHPNWNMGNKITIDSATLMNKGLEFIEAKWLFDLEPEQIEIVVHRQSVVHSAVEYNDYSVIAQLGVPDMKIPIQYALLYPDRLECPTKHLSLTDYGTLTFGKPDYETFKCLTAAIKAIGKGGAYPCLVNSANEEAVRAFLSDEISFIEIGEIVSSVNDEFAASEISCYEDIMKADKAAREFVRNRIASAR
jgi:1-deoxy-D-xylulose-5-phosphate reductoisomerase